MKWHKNRKKRISNAETGLYGRKNNFKFYIKSYTVGWGDRHIGWYVIVTDQNTRNSYNSLSDNIWFNETEDVKTWCEDYAKKNKNNRIKK